MSPNTKSPEEIVLPPIRFSADGPNDDIKKANLEAVLPSPGYAPLALIIADGIVKRADVVVLDYSANQVVVRYQIDGFWHNMPVLDRNTGDFLLASLKRLANLNVEERRARQQGAFSAEFLRRKFPGRVISQGVKTGERVAIYLERKKPPTETLDECGMRPAIVERTKQLLGATAGFFVVGGMPGDGLSTSWRATLTACDRFMRDYFVVEDAARVETDVINVARATYDAAAQEDPASILPRLLLRQPDAIAVTEMATGRIIDTYCDLVERQEKLILTRAPAKSTVDAVLRLLARKPTVEKLAGVLSGVLCHRLIRKLCERCKRSYQPSPKLMEQLGLPPGRVAVMYQRYEPRQEDFLDSHGRPLPIRPCNECGGTGFVERTALFELLVVDDSFRRVLLQDPRPEKLAAAARQAGMITLRDEGILLAARGLTSVDELQRALNK